MCAIISPCAGSLQPLTGAQQNASGVPPHPTHSPTPAITDACACSISYCAQQGVNNTCHNHGSWIYLRSRRSNSASVPSQTQEKQHCGSSRAANSPVAWNS